MLRDVSQEMWAASRRASNRPCSRGLSLQGLATWRLQSAKHLRDDLLNNKGPQRTGGPLSFLIELLRCDRLTGETDLTDRKSLGVRGDMLPIPVDYAISRRACHQIGT